MTYTGLDNLTSTDFSDLMTFPSIDTPIFYPLIIFCIFIVLTVGSYFREKESKGEGNFLSSMAVASVITITLSTILRLLEWISRDILIMNLAIGLVLIALYLLTDK